MVKLLKRSVTMRNKLMLFDSKNILLIDDRQDNIDMAKEFGWNQNNRLRTRKNNRML